jgi:hypothetical protein
VARPTRSPRPGLVSLPQAPPGLPAPPQAGGARSRPEPSPTKRGSDAGKSPGQRRGRRSTTGRGARADAQKGDEILLVVGGKYSHVVLYLVDYPKAARRGHTGPLLPSSCDPNGGGEGAEPEEFPNLVELGRVQPHGTVLSIAMDRAATLLVTGGEAKVVELWSVPRATMAKKAGRPETLFLCKSAVHSIALTLSGDTLAVGTSGHTEVYALEHRPPPDFKGGDALEELSAGGEGGADKAFLGTRPDAIFAYEPLLYLECPAHQGGVAFATRQASMRQLCEVAAMRATDPNYQSMRGGESGGLDTPTSTDPASSTRILAVGGNQLVSVFDIQTGATLRKMPRDGRVRCVALSNDGSTLVVGGFDRKVVLHGVDEGANLCTFAPGTEELQVDNGAGSRPGSASCPRGPRASLSGMMRESAVNLGLFGTFHTVVKAATAVGPGGPTGWHPERGSPLGHACAPPAARGLRCF